MSKINGLVSKRTNKVVLFVIYDIVALVVSAALAIMLRFDFSVIPEVYQNNLYSQIIVDVITMICIFSIFRLYSSSWKYASITEMIGIIDAVFVYELVNYFYKNHLRMAYMPKSYFIIQALILFILIGGMRFSYRVLRYLIIKMNKNNNQINTMVIGAGDAGRLLVMEMHNDKSGYDNKIVCFIDDDKNKKGTYLKGIPVVGNRRKIIKACKEFNIKEIIIAMPSAPKSEIAEIVEICQKTDCDIKILPRLSSMIGKNIAETIKPLSYEDFLGRDQIIIDINEITNSIENKVIMVTGGGGSIGSELCRQIASCSPKELIIFDIYENNAYDIEQELLRTYSKLNLKTIIGSVRDYDRLEKIFKDNKIDQVFHAAAHKHVPLMEESPNEAIKNNCLGTLNVAKLCDKYKVKKMVLISTDKAVRPTNVMGASKRICEMIIQTLNNKSKNTDYVAVRFGNVLGSNGSVIPLFLKQIDEGGPVTVTHKEITRFFMTIPEAVSLVLQAGCYAKGGEIFILDMGEPVKIYDLAEKLIKYKGYEPNEDIKIKITGLRPGEKLYEEILMDEEGLQDTPNKLIHIGKPIKLKEDKFLKDLDSLIEEAEKNNKDIKEKIAKLVPTYTIDEREGK